jgi:hypothetical protein
MISPITSASAASPTSAVQNNPTPKTPAPSQKQDSVQLSAAALKASGDADHDGDSH